MRQHFALAVAGSLTCALHASESAAQTMPNQPILGVSMQNLQSTCYIRRGPASFQRKFSAPLGSGAKAVVVLSEVFAGVSDTGNALNIGYQLSGEAVLKFSAAGWGRILFRQPTAAPPAYNGPIFRNYSESYNAATSQLIVTFVIAFPNCYLPVYLVLEPVV